VLACSRGLDCGIQGKKIGLLRDVVDSLDNGADLVAQFAQVLYLARCLSDGHGRAVSVHSRGTRDAEGRNQRTG
jgi:hypothetical protein